MRADVFGIIGRDSHGVDHQLAVGGEIFGGVVVEDLDALVTERFCGLSTVAVRAAHLIPNPRRNECQRRHHDTAHTDEKHGARNMTE